MRPSTQFFSAIDGEAIGLESRLISLTMQRHYLLLPLKPPVPLPRLIQELPPGILLHYHLLVRVPDHLLSAATGH